MIFGTERQQAKTESMYCAFSVGQSLLKCSTKYGRGVVRIMLEVDGSNIQIGATAKGQSGEYRGTCYGNTILEEAIYLFCPKDFVSSDGEKIIFIYRGKPMKGNLVDLISELLGHETLHMLLHHLLGLDACTRLNNIDDFIRDDFKEILRNSINVEESK